VTGAGTLGTPTGLYIGSSNSNTVVSGFREENVTRGLYNNATGTQISGFLPSGTISVPVIPQLFLGTGGSPCDHNTCVVTLAFSGSSTGIGYNYRSCVFTKIGSWVTLQVTMAVNALPATTGATASLQFTGVPFPTFNVSNQNSDFPLVFQNVITGAIFSGEIAPNQSHVDLVKYTLSTGATTLMVDTDFSTTTYISFTITFETAS
jgi:hypothetical protein